jgi:Right handed beta helix region
MMFSVVVLLLVGRTYALDVTVGKADCVGCSNYFKTDVDAQPVIQAACEAVRKAGGGKVQIQAGEYVLGKNFQVYSNTHFTGAGMGLTTLKLVDKAKPWKVGTSLNAGFLRAAYKSYNDCNNIKISSFTLNGNKVNQNTDADSEYGRYGLFTEGCTNVYIDTVEIMNFQGYGFDPHGWKSAPGGPLYGKNLTIANCLSHDNDWDGFTLDQTDGILVKNCFSRNNGRHGFNIVTGSHNVVIDNVRSYLNGYYYHTGSPGCGLIVQNNQAYGTNTVTVKSSLFEADKKSGVCTNDVFNIVFDKNNIKSKNPCIILEDTSDVSITNNVCNNTNIIQKKNVIDITETNNTYVSSVETPSGCLSGNQNKSVCCLATCINVLGQPQCGGIGCGLLQGNSAGCCSTQILASARKCTDFPPPCIL